MPGEEEEPMPKSIAELIRDEVRRRVDEALKPSRTRVEKLTAGRLKPAR